MLHSVHTNRSFYLIFILTLVLSACAGGSPTGVVKSPESKKSPVTVTPGTPYEDAVEQDQLVTPSTHPDNPTILPRISTPQTIDHKNTQYILSAELNYNNHHLAVDEHIIYHNNAPEPLSDLLLMVEPVYYSDVFTLSELRWENGDPVGNYKWEGSQLRLPLPEPLEPGETISLNLSYELDLPSPDRSTNKRPVPFGYTERQTNLVDWYPFVPPYIPGAGWLSHEAGFYGEHLAYETSDFEVAIKLLDEREDLIIAASAPAEIDDEWHRFQFKDARNFVWSVSHNYQVMTDTVDSVTVLSYSFPIHTNAGEAVLQTTVESLALYSELFGPYPREMLSVVEADFLDGMEYDGLYFLSNGFYNLYTNTPGEYLIAISAHETAHQWWYAMVGNDQALEPWLDEALCTYSERLFFENEHPEVLEWWWNYRIFYYKPQGWVDDSIYNPHGVTNAYRSYRDAVYLNGALFLEDLRLLIGDEAFFDFLRDYAQSFTHKIATTSAFFTLLQKYTTEDITPITDKYFSESPE